MILLHQLRYLATLACGVILLFFSRGAEAGTASAVIQIVATVNNVCIISGTPGATMNYQPLQQGNQDFDGPTLTVTCTMGASSSISIESGAHDANAAQGAAHAVSDGNGHYLSYNTYSDPGRNQIWGSVASGNTVDAIADGTAHSYEIYVRFPGGQTSMPSGDYSDTLTVDVSY